MRQIFGAHDHHQDDDGDADQDTPGDIPPEQDQQARAVTDHAGSAEAVCGGDVVVLAVAEEGDGGQNGQKDPELAHRTTQTTAGISASAVRTRFMRSEALRSGILRRA